MYIHTVLCIHTVLDLDANDSHLRLSHMRKWLLCIGL